MPSDDETVDGDALEKAAELFAGMNDATLEAVTENWMIEALKRRQKKCEKQIRTLKETT